MTLNSSIAACDAELEALTIQVERARAALAREKELQQVSASPPPSAAAPSSCNADLQRQIDELQRQLGLKENEMHVAVAIGTSYANDANDKHHRTVDSTCKMPHRRSTIQPLNDDPDQPPICPERHASVVQIPEVFIVDEKQEENHPLPCNNGGTRAPYNTPSPQSFEPAKGASEHAKQKHEWEKPDWALPSSAIASGESIQSESIQNGLKQVNTGGYERKVRPTETLALIPGMFVAHQEKSPDPRMVWIVVNIDGSKVGKIVMHLHGNVMPMTDIFLELKGLELKYTASAKQWVVDDIEPNFYVHVGSTQSFTGPKTACFGAVLEGHDIVQQLLTAVQSTDHASIVTIKQSHIFPVKKAK